MAVLFPIASHTAHSLNEKPKNPRALRRVLKVTLPVIRMASHSLFSGSGINDVDKIIELAPDVLVLVVKQAFKLGNEGIAATKLAVKIGITLYFFVDIKHFKSG